MLRMIDTHIHLDLLDDLERQLADAAAAGVGCWLVPGVSPEAWPDIMTLVNQFEGVYAAPGLHPRAASSCRPEDLSRLRTLLDHPRALAVGEVGLDRQIDVGWQAQEETFIAMINVARERGKPLLIHSRKSIDRTLEILGREQAQQVGGIFHAFSGSLETAARIIALGFGLGVGGVLTWSTARRLPEVVRDVPAEALVLETDAPFLAPVPYRGQLNRSANLGLVAEKVAQLKGWSLEETVRVTTENAQRILKL